MADGGDVHRVSVAEEGEDVEVARNADTASDTTAEVGMDGV